MVRLSKKKTFFALCLVSFLISAFVLNRRGVDEVIPLTPPISAASSSAQYKVKTSDSQFLLSLRSTPLIKEAASPKLEDNFCTPSSHSVVFLMRIAKCASTSLVELVNSLSKRNKFMFVFNRSGAYNWKQEEIMQVSEVCSRKLARSQELKEFNVKELVVYARHLYFTDFRSLEYTYITFVRDPVSRVASSYFYYHFSHKPGIRQLIPPQHRGENLLDCVRFNHDGCVANLMTKYFCGHDHFCGSGSPEAVSRAKENMKNKFIVIGVMEMMKSSMDLLRLLLPAVFDGTSDLPELNANDVHHDLTEEEQYMIRIMNMADYQVYYFAIDLLNEQLSHCSITT